MEIKTKQIYHYVNLSSFSVKFTYYDDRFFIEFWDYCNTDGNVQNWIEIESDTNWESVFGWLKSSLDMIDYQLECSSEELKDDFYRFYVKVKEADND